MTSIYELTFRKVGTFLGFFSFNSCICVYVYVGVKHKTLSQRLGSNTGGSYDKPGACIGTLRLYTVI